MEYHPNHEANNGIRFYFMLRFWDRIPIFCSVRQAARADERPNSRRDEGRDPASSLVVQSKMPGLVC
jgi:hypothetical protein